MIGNDHANWYFSTLLGSADQVIVAVANKTELEIAQDFLANGRIDECGNRLRKAVEANLTSFLDQARKKKGLDQFVDRKKFATLHSKLNEAIELIELDGFHQFAELLQSKFSVEELSELASSDEIQIAKFNTLPREKRGKVIGRLYAARNNLQKNIVTLLSEASRRHHTAITLLNEVKRIKDRILNPASHAGSSPLYTKEAEDAIEVIRKLDVALTEALATLPTEPS